MPQSGYLLISDISGYTSFLTKAELEHAHDILQNLFHALLDSIKVPLVVSKLEGDAIFCYTPDGSLMRPQTLVDAIENIYCIFAQTRENMRLNTTCTCTACTMIPTLDLKFVVHHGEFIVADMRGREELSGADVILIHRLLKNTVVEEKKVPAYVYFTEACKLGEISQSLIPHTEHYEHIGEVKGYIQDLHPVWQTRREQHRVRVMPESAWVISECDVPIPPALVWDYVTEPNQKNRWMQVEAITASGIKGGRQTVGSKYHCAHGKDQIQDFVIQDWRPFEYLTTQDIFPIAHVPGLWTIDLTPTTNGTHLRMMYNKPEKLKGIRKLFSPLIVMLLKKIFSQFFTKFAVRIPAIIQEDLDSGKLVVPTAPSIAEIEAERAAVAQA